MKKKLIAAWAEYVAGPGWSNNLVWYVYRNHNGKIEVDCLQPEDQSPEIVRLFPISAIVSSTFFGAVDDVVNKKK